MKRRNLSVGVAVAVLAGFCSLSGSTGAGTSLAATNPGSHGGTAWLVVRSETAMRSVHQAHSEATTTSWMLKGPTWPARHEFLHVSGDCTYGGLGRYHVRVGIRLHVQGRIRVGNHPVQPIDTSYIYITTGPRKGERASQYHQRFWERSGRTHNRWQQIPIATVTREQAYMGSVFAQPCPSDGVFRLLTPNQFIDQGTAVVNGQASRHVYAQKPRGDQLFLHLFIDQTSFRWNRVIMAFQQHDHGRLLDRTHTVIDYSRFNQNPHIAPPVSS